MGSRPTEGRPAGIDRRDLALCWVSLAVGALVLSGIFAFLTALSRTPGLSALFTDPAFMRRALVVHVDLGVAVWFTAVPVAFFHLLNRGRAPGAGPKLAFGVALGGVLLMTVAGLWGEGEPILSNYVPVISHPHFIAGLALYLTGATASFLDRGLLCVRAGGASGDRDPLETAQMGVRVGGLYLLLSVASLVASHALVPPGLPSASHYEMTMWGGGHLLQFSNVSFLLVCWTLVLGSWLGRSPVSRGQAFAVFGLLGAPAFLVPFLVFSDVTGSDHREGFTQLMRWGLFPPVALYLALALARLRRERTRLSLGDLRPAVFTLSAALVILGFVFGALVRGPDLRLPGHYHASIGAVTLGYMGAVLVLLRDLGAGAGPPFASRRARWVPLAYGVGQIVFSGGMFVAGLHGMTRKTYGVEQTLRNSGQTTGLWIMGVGGAIALAGGVAFSVLALSAILSRRREARTGQLGSVLSS